MHEKTFAKIKEYIRLKKYIMTFHAEEEMSDDGLTIFDVEHVVLTGKIIEKQSDNISKESKYIIEGKTLKDNVATVVTKISVVNKLVIITVFIGSAYDL